MKGLLLINVVSILLGCTCGYPDGVGAYAYQDSTGNRYGGTYGLKNGQAFNLKENQPLPANPIHNAGFQDVEDFFPEFLRNFENLLQEAFRDNLEHQRVALNTAKKAYDLASNQPGYSSFNDFAPRFPSFPTFDPFPAPSFNMPGFAPFQNFMNIPNTPNMENSAFSAAAAGPGYSQHMIALHPEQPGKPNINVQNFDEPAGTGTGTRNGPQFYSVQSSSYSSSSDFNGKKSSMRGGETVINDNGKITKYKLNS